jgi:hypothetical protein
MVSFEHKLDAYYGANIINERTERNGTEKALCHFQSGEGEPEPPTRSIFLNDSEHVCQIQKCTESHVDAYGAKNLIAWELSHAVCSYQTTVQTYHMHMRSTFQVTASC